MQDRSFVYELHFCEFEIFIIAQNFDFKFTQPEDFGIVQSLGFSKPSEN